MFQIVDWSGYFFRAYYGLPKLTDKNGENINAVFGFFKMMFSLLQKKPDYFVIALDSPIKTKRAESFEGYKANRPPLPDNFRRQIKLIKQIIKDCKFPYLEAPGYEADDIIFTLAKMYDTPVEIVSADKDLKQIIGWNITMFDPMKNKKITKQDFVLEMGFEPDQLLNYLSIVWDASDNVPWVKWIWKTGALKLIQNFSSLENIYSNLDQIDEKTKQKLIDSKENAFLSKSLISLMQVPELEKYKLEDWKVDLHPENLQSILIEEYGFNSFWKNIDKINKDTEKRKILEEMSLF